MPFLGSSFIVKGPVVQSLIITNPGLTLNKTFLKSPSPIPVSARTLSLGRALCALGFFVLLNF